MENWYIILDYQSLILLVIISLNIIQSEILAYNGFLKAAGTFFSKKKCPAHANGYTTNGTNGERS